MKITEIFTSIQGEGSSSGYLTLFIRLSGCNLRCEYCDTPDAQNGVGRDISPAFIAEEAFRSGVSHVCITGGEPLIQKDELGVLLKMLSNAGHNISIETNGTIDFRPFQAYATICMDVKCPSSGVTSDLSLLPHIRENDSVKYVIGTSEDLMYAHKILSTYPVTGEVFWSPVFGSDHMQIISYIMKQKLPVRFQIQLHKVIGVQ
ncbi:MAG: 7-carboxy-7-deazaguanine synthase [Methanomicrobiales archaeon HGW-Methanomicrobiales-4]|nr:MAG: 7-carboxy-7-deazaguanine synthase [Methanomicrobiales archaeon HGW-Methanomicrobiales-4]